MLKFPPAIFSPIRLKRINRGVSKKREKERERKPSNCETNDSINCVVYESGEERNVNTKLHTKQCGKMRERERERKKNKTSDDE